MQAQHLTKTATLRELVWQRLTASCPVQVVSHRLRGDER
jgi:hypothetical protein